MSEAEIREIWTEKKPGFLPDLFEFNEQAMELRIYEIEDTHPLTGDKLFEIADFWFGVDDETQWRVRLFVTDRYGLSEREIDLPEIFFQMLGGDPNDPATQQVAREAGVKL